MRTLPRCFLLAAILAASAVCGAAEELELTVAQAREAARTAYRQGDIESANAIARIILASYPDDPSALLVLAATEPMMGRPKEGRQAGVRAWSNADDPGLRHEAAFYTSKAYAAEDRFFMAQLWLRRAYHTADSEEEREQLEDVFDRLRSVSPWLMRFSFDVAPSSNLNGGASSEFLVIDDTFPVGQLSGTARALSGVTSSVQGQAVRTLSQSPDHLTTLTFNGYRTFNKLSDEAKSIAPDAEGSDFDYGVAEVVLGYRRVESPFILPDRISVAVGQTWYGGEQLDKVSRLTLSKKVKLTPYDWMRFEFQAEHRDPDDDAQDRQGREVNWDYFHRMKDGHLLSFGVSGTNVTSDEVNLAYTGVSARMGALMVDDIWGVRLGGNLEYSFNDYPDYRIWTLYVDDGREDREFSADLDIYFDRIAYMGFVPVITLSGSKTTSNISRFESDSLGISIGFNSAF
jgi:hypothetical protein